ncbi:hypothetical protein JQ596_16165 [Bradyrhizobium manausense]|uniref:hypothetical protein n=1 Tax=Bradyrhizobium TaxID=374 RepID=UPI001BAC7BB2|nr:MULTISPECIES: hypothetical protein [Bradyrhizobium]MBR0827076.1 hypothetical protein [Bradyrhizobium manausense]UVO28327.1 hypothetical protein KUF59_38690 [Bradyrhizobium arachidis]
MRRRDFIGLIGATAVTVPRLGYAQKKTDMLSIEQASKFILAVNLKTAKALGIAVPANLLAIADEVIE